MLFAYDLAIKILVIVLVERSYTPAVTDPQIDCVWPRAKALSGPGDVGRNV